ncbi:hypothetical protein FHR84_003551 [Actinopolyspora biskrensis]|uniref:Uncharacterized protein n=1 Tax=Actinopolyspora biskrensis TaxID=1470178 RepID=A0A852Z2G5_9ACTN|nr:hypothetical protein [Actinopolyspora biskrensis]NYH80202.1 hypothetical protein [Actinopolyspora biskrensis]
MTVLGYTAVLAAESRTALSVLAQDSGPGVQDEEFGKSTPLGLFLVLVLLIAIVFLARSLSKQLRKVPERFDEQRAAAAAPARVKRAERARAVEEGTGEADEGTAGPADAEDSAPSREGHGEEGDGSTGTDTERS